MRKISLYVGDSLHVCFSLYVLCIWNSLSADINHNLSKMIGIKVGFQESQ